MESFLNGHRQRFAGDGQNYAFAVYLLFDLERCLLVLRKPKSEQLCACNEARVAAHICTAWK